MSIVALIFLLGVVPVFGQVSSPGPATKDAPAPQETVSPAKLSAYLKMIPKFPPKKTNWLASYEAKALVDQNYGINNSLTNGHCSAGSIGEALPAEYKEYKEYSYTEQSDEPASCTNMGEDLNNFLADPQAQVGVFLKDLPTLDPLELVGIKSDLADILKPETYYGDSKGASVGANNKGLITYIKSLGIEEDPLMGSMREFYYRELKKKENGKPVTLLDQLKDRGLEEGYLWKKAMELSNNDPLKAMRIIAVCGHDDKSRQEKYSCPDGESPFFISGSLGKDTDVPQKLKDRIGFDLADWGSQGDEHISDSKGFGEKTGIHSKYYHVYGSAFVACEMMARGYPVEYMTGKDGKPGISKKLAYVYRMQRLLTETCVHVIPSDVSRWLLTQLKDKNPEYDLEQVLYKPLDEILAKYDEKWIVDKKDKPKDMSFEQYVANRSYFRRILTDFLWTTTQHQLGSQFAANNCKVGEKKKPGLQNFFGSGRKPAQTPVP